MKISYIEIHILPLQQIPLFSQLFVQSLKPNTLSSTHFFNIQFMFLLNYHQYRECRISKITGKKIDYSLVLDCSTILTFKCWLALCYWQILNAQAYLWLPFYQRSFVIELESLVEFRIWAYLHSYMNKVVIKDIIMGHLWNLLISKKLCSRASWSSSLDWGAD